MTPTTNDETILKLKEQIEAKKKDLAKTERFNPITSCSIDMGTGFMNIHTMKKEQLIQLLVALNSYRKSAEELNLLDEYVLSGFKVDEWIADLKAKLMNINRNNEMDKLRSMEKRLQALLSLEKRTELELGEIASDLGIK